jgi:hypothetical protein
MAETTMDEMHEEKKPKCLEFGNFVITLIYIVLNTASGSNSSSPNKHEYCISE